MHCRWHHGSFADLGGLQPHEAETYVTLHGDASGRYHASDTDLRRIGCAEVQL